jgi:hypothetical protein
MTRKKEQAIDIVPEFTENKNGVRIKKCCSSCQHHQPLDQNGPHRLCTFNGAKKVVFKFEVCQHWEISDAINDIRTIGHGV